MNDAFILTTMVSGEIKSHVNWENDYNSSVDMLASAVNCVAESNGLSPQRVSVDIMIKALMLKGETNDERRTES